MFLQPLACLAGQAALGDRSQADLPFFSGFAWSSRHSARIPREFVAGADAGMIAVTGIADSGDSMISSRTFLANEPASAA